METIIKDLKLMNRNLNIIPGEFADSITVSDAMNTLDIMGDLQNNFIVEGEQLTVERNEGSYSLNCECLPYLIKRFNKKLIKTEKQILSHAIKHDKRHLKFVLWFEIIKTLEMRLSLLDINSLLAYKLDNEKSRYNTHLNIETFITGDDRTKNIIKGLNRGLWALCFFDISAFIQFYKEQTK